MNPKRPEPPEALTTYSARADEALVGALPDVASVPQRLHEAMRYAVLGGGKRLRPVLVYASGAALGAALDVLDSSACAVEFIHAYSLVHDDLPAMDDDSLRRGRPTCHVAFGEAMAILAGDALQALAFEALTTDRRLRRRPEVQLRMLETLSRACGSQGMAGGQAIDLSAIGRRLDAAQLEHMHERKTGALIRTSVRLGALAADETNAEVLDALDRYARAIGLAFQIRDDILDVEGESETLGKTIGKDAADNKPTFPGILGMRASRERLAQLTTEAIDSLAPLGKRAAELVALARYIAERDS